MFSKHDKFVIYTLSFIFPIVGVLFALFWWGGGNSEKSYIGKKAFFYSIAGVLLMAVFALIGIASFNSSI